MTLTVCQDLSAADWIVHSELPWQQLVCFGPAGFDAYARLRFLPDPIRPGQSENDVQADWRADQLPTLWDVLATHTTTPEDCYFCVWEGFGQAEPDSHDDAGYVEYDDNEMAGAQRPDARPGLAPIGAAPPSIPRLPKVLLPNRAYWMFRGSLADVGTWDTAQGPPDRIRLDAAEPAFVWPADHAWSVARDVDPHWAGIGAQAPLIIELTSDPRLDVVAADPTQHQPSYQ